jgi:hypothetical protein
LSDHLLHTSPPHSDQGELCGDEEAVEGDEKRNAE